MKVLFVGRSDWANVSNRVARAMNEVAGATVARVLTERPHPFGYREDMVISERTHKDLLHFAAEVDWLISTGDGDYDFFRSVAYLLPLKAGARLATCHVGSAYRKNCAAYNEMDKLFPVRFIGADLFRFARGDSRAVPYFAPPEKVSGVFASASDRPVIAHSPTNRTKKGTDAILAVLERFEDQATVDLIEGVPFAACAARRENAQIFVDQLSEIGGFGASAVEAMAAGCAVVANISNVVPEVFEFFPKPPIAHVRTAEEMGDVIAALLRDPELLHERQRASLAWAAECASPRAVSSYWVRNLSTLQG